MGNWEVVRKDDCRHKPFLSMLLTIRSGQLPLGPQKAPIFFAFSLVGKLNGRNGVQKVRAAYRWGLAALLRQVCILTYMLLVAGDYICRDFRKEA